MKKVKFVLCINDSKLSKLITYYSLTSYSLLTENLIMKRSNYAIVETIALIKISGVTLKGKR